MEWGHIYTETRSAAVKGGGVYTKLEKCEMICIV